MATAKAAPRGLAGIFAKLHNIKFGGGTVESGKGKMPRHDLAYILRNIATLIRNGLSLTKSLSTLASEPSLRKYRSMLLKLRRRIEGGESFSSAMAEYPNVFNDIIVSQVRVGERSGTISETLRRIATQVEQANQLKSRIIKRLSYPVIVLTAGSAVVLFMLVYVVPQFEETYKSARVPLPFMTKVLMWAGQFILGYSWMFILAAVLGVWFIRRARRSRLFAYNMDRRLLRLPVVGDWLRDMAVLQFMDVMAVMMQSGFKLVDALSYSASAVSNHAVRRAVESLRSAVVRGERLSHELERHSDTFPPVVSQLVIVGEQTGTLSNSTAEVREHLRGQIERKADLFVSSIEPILTIGMALAIGVILLAIYMPMFSMVDVVDSME